MGITTVWVADHMLDNTAEHLHNFYQLVYFQTNSGSILIDGQRYLGRCNRIVLIPPMLRHCIENLNDARAIEIKFLLDDEQLLDGVRKLPLSFILSDVVGARNALSDIVCEGASHNPYCNLRTNALLTLFLINCVRELAGGPRESLQTHVLCTLPIPRDDERLATDLNMIRLSRYVDENLQKQITLNDLAQVVHFNKSYLIDLFKEEWGLTPTQYVNNVRLSRAKDLLINTGETVTEIAFSVGFQSIHYFSRYFKDKVRMSPLEYRNRYRAQEDQEERTEGI